MQSTIATPRLLTVQTDLPSPSTGRPQAEQCPSSSPSRSMMIGACTRLESGPQQTWQNSLSGPAAAWKAFSIAFTMATPCGRGFADDEIGKQPGEMCRSDQRQQWSSLRDQLPCRMQNRSQAPRHRRVPRRRTPAFLIEVRGRFGSTREHLRMPCRRRLLEPGASFLSARISVPWHYSTRPGLEMAWK